MKLGTIKIAACALTSVLLIGSTGSIVYASDIDAALPSAGINYILAPNATSLQNIKEDVDNTKALENDGIRVTESGTVAAVGFTVGNQSTTVMQTNKPVVSAEVKEKILNDIEREIDGAGQDSEEESFKNLVIAQVHDYVNVRDTPSEEGEIVGKLYNNSVGTFLSEEDGWYQINSGSVTGYVKGEYCVTGDAAAAIAKEVGTRIAKVNTTTLKVREQPGLEAPVLGLIPIDDELIVTEEEEGWVKVNIEEGDGYISSDYVNISTEFVQAESKAEEEARLAKEEAERKAAKEAAAKKAAQNAVQYSTDSSTPVAESAVYKTGGSASGQSVVDFAMQFVGNPYVYGGTSLTNGTDCSGFVMSVYNNFGVNLPHSSAADRNVGSTVNGLDNAQPGDIVCYSGHVGIYAGNGKLVHASTSKTGIIVSNADYRSILSIRRVF